MQSPFAKSFDEILNDILTDYRNQEFRDAEGKIVQVDLSQGSLLFIRAACTASAVWGLYQAAAWTGDQIFADTCSTANLERHAGTRGLTRKAGETDDALLARLLEFIRRPPAGGNRYDYVKWALEVEGIVSAICIPTAQGPGTVDVVVSADPASGSEVPGAPLLAAVYAHITGLSPAAALVTRVLPPTIVTQDVTMTLAAPGLDPVAVAQAITAYINSLTLGESLYVSQLIATALGGNAGDVTVTVPAANVVADPTHLIRPGVIHVT